MSDVKKTPEHKSDLNQNQFLLRIFAKWCYTLKHRAMNILSYGRHFVSWIPSPERYHLVNGSGRNNTAMGLHFRNCLDNLTHSTRGVSEGTQSHSSSAPLGSLKRVITSKCLPLIGRRAFVIALLSAPNISTFNCITTFGCSLMAGNVHLIAACIALCVAVRKTEKVTVNDTCMETISPP